jgi:hypothetical protein
MNKKDVDVKKLAADKKAIEDSIAAELQHQVDKKAEAEKQIADAVKAIED